MSNPALDPNFLRRQREQREAKKRASAAQQASQSLGSEITPQNRQKAIDARIQEWLNTSPSDQGQS